MHVCSNHARRGRRFLVTGALAAALTLGTPAVGASAAPAPSTPTGSTVAAGGTAPVAERTASRPATSAKAQRAKERAKKRAKAQRQKKRRLARIKKRRAIARAKVTRALKIARNQKGDPYRYGASGPGSFDCSGLVNYSFRRAGFEGAPRTSSAQARWARRIPRQQMRPGDLVFFTGSGGVYHVGVFGGWKHGKRRIVHAPSTGQRVQSAPIWTGSWFAGTMRAR